MNTLLQDRFADEDADDSQVKENWWEEEEEEDLKKQPSTQQISAAKKKTKKQIIAEKEEKEKLAKEQKLREKELKNKVLTAEELSKLRIENQKMVEQADLEIALETFGISSGSKVKKEEFDKLRTNLVGKLSSVSSEPYYTTFLEDLFRELCVLIDTDDLKKISSSLSALYNEKLKAQRNANNKKKKNKGTSIKMEKNMIAQTFDGEGSYDDDLDDFM